MKPGKLEHNFPLKWFSGLINKRASSLGMKKGFLIFASKVGTLNKLRVCYALRIRSATEKKTFY